MGGHFLTVHDTGYSRTRLGGYMVVELEGGYDMVVIMGDGGNSMSDLVGNNRCITTSVWQGDKDDHNVFLLWQQGVVAWEAMVDVKQMIVFYHRPFYGTNPEIVQNLRKMQRILETHVLASMDMDLSEGKTDTYFGVEYPQTMVCTYVRKDMVKPEDLHIQRYGKSPFYTPNVLVTILGCCRQQSAMTYFRLSDIMEELNYPHYTKEILQQVRYLKDKSIIPNEWTRYVFRRGFLDKCRTDVPDNLYQKWKDQFYQTEFFLMEISSRKTYQWKGLYLHHAAWDGMDNAYDFPFRDEMERRELTDEEIEQDLVLLRKELYPRPLLVVSHFSWQTSGKRYELIRLLEKLCHQMDIPFWDQSEAVKKWGHDIVKPEAVPSHYTLRGREIVSTCLYDHIAETLCAKRRIMYNVYYTDKERVAKHTFHGLGDFLRGTLYLFQECRRNHVELKVNFSNHHLGDMLVCNNHLSVEECRNIKYIFMFDECQIGQPMHVFCNKYPREPVDEECIEFIREKCLCPRPHFAKKIDNYMYQLGLDDKSYCVLHVRLLDMEEFQEQRLEHIRNALQKVYDKEACHILLLASNKCYHNHISFPYVVKTDLQCGHLGLDTTTREQAEDTMLEFMLMTKSKKIFQMSVYEWGSGFSQIAHLIYKVPLEKISF